MWRKIITRLQYFVFDLNDYFPLIGKPLVIVWSVIHRIKFMIGKKFQEIRGNLNYEFTKTNNDKIYWINPNKINYILKKVNKNDKSPIIGGNWDKSKKLIENLEVYKSFKEKYKKVKKWEETEYYNIILREINSGNEIFGCKNKGEWDQYLKKLDHLYEYMIEKSIKLKLEFSNYYEWFEKLGIPGIFNEIVLNINRDGHFLLSEGEHIFILWKLLKAEEIPFKIKSRHKKWIKFKKDLKYFSRSGRLYQQITHPDLQDFPFKYGDSRFKRIKENLSITNGNLLDIGANFGYNCLKFENEGFDCFAVEINPIYRHFLKKIKIAELKQFKIISDSIFNYNRNNILVFDVVLALNIFHNLIVRKRTFMKLTEFLKRLKVKELFFGAHNPNEFKNSSVYRNFTPTQFTDYIIKNSCLTKAKFLNKTSDGRSLYKLT